MQLISADDERTYGSLDDLKAHIHERIDAYENLIAVGGRLLSLLDFTWMNHLEDIEALAESVRIRAYGQKDPLVEYRRDGKMLFERMETHFNEWICMNLFKMEDSVKRSANTAGATVAAAPQPQQIRIQNKPDNTGKKKIGRNDPCPCGSGKKYKRCCGA
jgi:preprotein translocase subunit SecA